MSGLNALIIDDQAENVEVMGRLLNANGVDYQAIYDTTQLESVMIQMGPIDVIFLDLEMPDRTGYEILKVLRTEFRLETPIIACTVHTNEIAHARDVGFDGFIAKPLDLNLFPSQLSDVLNGKAVWDAS